MTNDYGLRKDYKHRYDDLGRWMLAGAIFLGWILGLTVDVHETVLGFLFAFLAGGVVLNVLKEELPEERNSRFWPFFFGSAGYAALLFFMR